MGLSMLIGKSGRVVVLNKSALRLIAPCLARGVETVPQRRNYKPVVGRSPTEHPESTFGKESYQTGVTHRHTDPPHTDLTNAGGGCIILPDSQLPSEYPETADAWIASAKKYGLPIEEYKPYPNDGYNNLGDYPDFPPVHACGRDFWHDWDIPPTKNDWGHVLHFNELDLVAFTEDIYTPSVIPLWKEYLKMWAIFFGFVFVFAYSALYMPFHGPFRSRTFPHGWDPITRRYNPEKAKTDAMYRMYRFPEHPPHYN